jgi:hypothetical protein
MSQESIHPTEELAPYVRGELGAPEAERVRQHIARCRDCAAELAAISALVGSPEPPALNDLERRSLHRGVFEELQVAGSPARRGLGARIAPALGAAALLAVLVFGGAQVLQGGLSGGDDAESSAGVAADSDDGAAGEGPLGLPASERTALSAQDGASSGSGYEDEAPAPEPALGDETTGRTEEAASQGGDAGGEMLYAGGEPYFEPGRRTLTREALRHLGSQRDPFDAFRALLTLRQVGLRDPLARALATSSFEPRLVRRCIRVVHLSADPRALPAYGAIGDFEGSDVLVLGFATGTSSRPDLYDIWVWPFGDCTSPIARLRGRI